MRDRYLAYRCKTSCLDSQSTYESTQALYSRNIVFVYLLVFICFVENLEYTHRPLTKCIAVVLNARDAIVSNVFDAFKVVDILHELGFYYFWRSTSDSALRGMLLVGLSCQGGASASLVEVHDVTLQVCAREATFSRASSRRSDVVLLGRTRETVGIKVSKGGVGAFCSHCCSISLAGRSICW